MNERLLLFVSTDYKLSGCLLFASGGVVVLFHLFMPRAQGLCDVVTRFIPHGDEVWLTIDDGPDPDDTPSILEAFAESNIKATFL